MSDEDFLIPIRRRSASEARAYVDGFEAGAREALRYLSADTGAAEHIEAIVRLMRLTLD